MRGRRWIWTIALVALGLLLLSAHRITSTEVVLFCVILPSIILHELAHGWVALAFGDDTAKRAGRLSLNPMAHVDPIGSVLVPALMILGGFGWFGWAKPVPVNLARLRSPRNQGVIVSLAGPFTNIILAGLAAVLFRAFGGLSILESGAPAPLWAQILFSLGLVNMWLAIFNMLPIPPLDGSVLVERALPARWWPRYLRLRRFMLPIVVIAVIIAADVHTGGTSLLGRFSVDTENWWLHLLGAPT